MTERRLTREEPPVTPSTRPEETPAKRAPGFLQTVSEVARDYPFGFYSALLDLAFGKGEFAKKE